MSKTLDRIKEISENLSGVATVKEYHVLRKLDEQLSKYENELILKNFSLDYDTALCEVPWNWQKIICRCLTNIKLFASPHR